jgi:hypothetical protein
LILGGCQTSTATPSANTSAAETTAAATVSNTSDIEGIFADLSSAIHFEDSMEIVADDYSDMLLGIAPESYTDCILYMGSGATAEELLIFAVSDKDSANALVQSLNTHIEDQKQAFSGYDPDELKILENAYIASSDTLVICCVCDNAKAAKEAIGVYIP